MCVTKLSPFRFFSSSPQNIKKSKTSLKFLMGSENVSDHGLELYQVMLHVNVAVFCFLERNNLVCLVAVSAMGQAG